jgi:predicted DsbA family dithiol-disulfide isomerase
MHDMLRARCAELGLPFAPPLVLANSRAAILAAEYARDHARFPEFSHRVFSAYFAEGRNIGDIEVLRAAAEEVGLDPEDLTRSLQAGEHLDRLPAAEADARRLGITGVPAFFIEGPPADDSSIVAPSQAKTLSRRIVGAQPLQVFQRALLDL